MHDEAIIALAVSLLGTIIVTTWRGAKMSGVLESAIKRLDEQVAALGTKTQAIESIPLLLARVDMAEKVVTAVVSDLKSIRPSFARIETEIDNLKQRVQGHSGELRAVRVPTGPEFRPVRRPSRPDTE